MPTRSPISRRTFVKGAALGAAAAAAFPTIIPSSALGDDKTAAPSERVMIGFIGIGKMGWSHLQRMAGRRDAQVIAVADVFAHRLDNAKKHVEDVNKKLERKGYLDAREDYRTVLSNKDVDAVLIAVPDHWHTAVAINACKAKKHVYCEKPLTLTIAEAKALMDAAKKHETIFQVGSQQRSEGPFRKVCEFIRNGRLGKIQQVQVALGGSSSKPCDLPGEQVPAGLNWDFWQGQAPQRDYNEIVCRRGLPDEYPFNPGWRDYKEYSGGYVTDWGAHHFDITQWALDMDHSGPVEVHPPDESEAKYGAKLIYRGSPVGDEITVTHVKETDQPKHGNGILFIGDKGKIFVDRDERNLWASEESIIKTPLESGATKLYESKGHHDNWFSCIRKHDRATICPAETGARSVTVCHLANLAYWHRKALKWDPLKWEFVGDAEANSWRSRERRKGYELPEA